MILELINSLSKTPDPIDIEKLPIPQIYLLHSALGAIAAHCGEGFGLDGIRGRHNFFKIPLEIEEEILECIELNPYENFREKIIAYNAAVKYWPKKKDFLLNALVSHLKPTTHDDPFENFSQTPSLVGCQEKTNHQVKPGQEIINKPISKPSTKPAPSSKKQPILGMSGIKTVIALLQKRSRSNVPLRLYLHLISCHDTKLSSRGKKIYSAGQAWAARQCKISLRASNYWFSIFKRWGIIGKRTNENPDLHRCSTWFICTSTAQIGHFRGKKDPRKKN